LATQWSVGVIPFDLNITGDYVPCRSPKTGVETLQSTIDTTAGLKILAPTELTGKTPQATTGFKPARVTTFENATRLATPDLSQVTGQSYLKYTGSRYSSAFGKATKTDTGKMVDLFSALKFNLKARQNLAINRVSLTPERYAFR
jgi:hypothetical protein